MKRIDWFYLAAFLLISLGILLSVSKHEESHSRDYTEQERQQFSEAHTSILKSCESLTGILSAQEPCSRFKSLELPPKELPQLPSAITLVMYILLLGITVIRVGAIVRQELKPKAKLEGVGFMYYFTLF